MKYTIGFKDLPFRVSSEQIIYIESEYNNAVNDIIVRNYERIYNNCKRYGYEFVYLPLLSSHFNMEVRSYYNPMCNNSKNIPIKSSFILDYMARPENRKHIPPSLLYYRSNVISTSNDEVILAGMSLDELYLYNEDFDYYFSQIHRDKKDAERNTPRFMIVSDTQADPEDILDPIADDGVCYSIDPIPSLEKQFDIETTQMVAEIQERVDKLLQKGISLYVLENILRPSIELSRLVITADYRIILPDYNNMEIEMTPLVKAVYLLFLRHTDGIPFKHLTDYRNELLQIYTDIRGGNLTDEMAKSVLYATSPFNNSINEKCARIREAFVAKFDERIAENYFVRGKRGEPKRITLSRHLVEWE